MTKDIEKEIENLRQKLNKFIENENQISSDELVDVSVELDKLINEYYNRKKFQ